MTSGGLHKSAVHTANTRLEFGQASQIVADPEGGFVQVVWTEANGGYYPNTVRRLDQMLEQAVQSFPLNAGLPAQDGAVYSAQALLDWVVLDDWVFFIGKVVDDEAGAPSDLGFSVRTLKKEHAPVEPLFWFPNSSTDGLYRGYDFLAVHNEAIVFIEAGLNYPYLFRFTPGVDQEPRIVSFAENLHPPKLTNPFLGLDEEYRQQNEEAGLKLAGLYSDRDLLFALYRGKGIGDRGTTNWFLQEVVLDDSGYHSTELGNILRLPIDIPTNRPFIVPGENHWAIAIPGSGDLQVIGLETEYLKRLSRLDNPSDGGSQDKVSIQVACEAKGT